MALITSCCDELRKHGYQMALITSECATLQIENLEIVADGFVDQWFSTCNLTSSATSFTFRMQYTQRSDLRAFLDQLSTYAEAQPLAGAGLRISFDNLEYEQDLLLNSLEHDAQFAIGSVISVFFLILFQTRSLAVTCAGFVHILLSVPLGFFFYRIILGQHFVGFLNGITIFIIMGIGADDVFVYFDCWRQSVVENPALRKPQVSTSPQSMRKIWTTTLQRHGPDHLGLWFPQNVPARVRLVLGRSISAMSVTSFSTAAAFGKRQPARHQQSAAFTCVSTTSQCLNRRTVVPNRRHRDLPDSCAADVWNLLRAGRHGEFHPGHHVLPGHGAALVQPLRGEGGLEHCGRRRDRVPRRRAGIRAVRPRPRRPPCPAGGAAAVRRAHRRDGDLLRPPAPAGRDALALPAGPQRCD